ncbi:Pre-mRNA-splicing factor SPP2 [Cytospora mali]|uniref:Pre-mRNA-splicing factor n=1 Tax=Cytospora mali TaxID=578113 RepID=A0A194VNP5_CYTMA|nr:Pre-mRNA-splicing factor SPP2 [Valsa mali]
MADQSSSRIAIRFGASSSSGSKSAPRPTPSTALGKRSRPQFDHDNDSDGDEPTDAQPETITHFGTNGAEYVDEESSRRNQPGSESRRDGSRERDSPANESREKLANLKKADEAQEEEPLKFGLTVSKKPKQDGSGSDVKEAEVEKAPKTADEEAIDALIGSDSGRQRLHHRTEEDAFRDAAAEAPEVDDIATYDAFPVEGFGESLLKGQGWDGTKRGPEAKEIKRRPVGMGLGAKKLTAEEDLGGWDSKGKRGDKRPRLDEYRRNRDRESSKREDKYRDSYKNERERERHRDRDRDRERDRDRDRDSHRHRDRDRRR